MSVLHRQPIDVFRPVTQQFEQAYRSAGPTRGALHVPLLVREAYIAFIAKRQGSMAASWLQTLRESGKLHYAGLPIVLDDGLEPGFIEVHARDPQKVSAGSLQSGSGGSPS